MTGIPLAAARAAKMQRQAEANGAANGVGQHAESTTPRPLMKQADPPADFPLDALGDVLGDAASAIAEKVQAPLAMAAGSVLAVASLAAQAQADVLLPYGQTRPLSLFFLTIAQSGDRKTSVDTEALVPVKMREARLREEHGSLAGAQAIAASAWRAQKAQIERGKSKIDARRAELEELGPEPLAPLEPILTLGDSTAEGLAKHMPSMPAALGIFSAEGGQFLSGHGFTPENKLRTAAGFAGLWDGAGFSRLLAGGGVIALRGRRLATSLMIQPRAATSVLDDPVLRDQGLLSRFLVSAPGSIAGTRLWKEKSIDFEPMMVRYQTYILEIFEAPIVTTNRLKNELAPRCLELSSDARDIWIKYHDGVEREMRRGGRFHELLDVAGKSAEQAARLAGVLAIVRDFKCVVIEAATMRQGCELASFYLNEARRIAEQVRIPPEIAGAQALLDWLRLRELKIVSATAFEKSGPRPLRFKGKLNPAIEVLEDAGWLIPVKDARRVWRVWQA